jgi:hypothetical protein
MQTASAPPILNATACSLNDSYKSDSLTSPIIKNFPVGPMEAITILSLAACREISADL